MNINPYETDIAWLKEKFTLKHGTQPTEVKIDCFVEKVSIFIAEGHDENNSREMALMLSGD